MALSEDNVRLKAVNHVTYNVRDKELAARFWEEVLGVKRIPKQVDSDHIIWLQIPSGAMVHLIETPDGPSMPSHHGAFEVDDIEAELKRLEGLGAEVLEGPIKTATGLSIAFIQAPDDVRIEVMQLPH